MARKFGVKDGKNRKWYGIERPTKDGFILAKEKVFLFATNQTLYIQST